MADPSSAGPRLRSTTEATPIASAQPPNGYDSIHAVHPSEAAEHGAKSDDPATQDGTAGAIASSAAHPRTTNAPRLSGKWWSEAWEQWGSVELENKGSVARDHLALERTFLAWLRTSLSFASIGIAITQLFRLNSSLRTDASTADAAHLHRLRHLGKPLGATFIAISVLMLFIGFHRYFEAQHYVIRGKFPASRGSIVLVSVVAGGLIVSSLVVILATSPAVFET